MFLTTYVFFTANVAVARSYISAATKLAERTHAVSMISLGQVIFLLYFYIKIYIYKRKNAILYFFIL